MVQEDGCADGIRTQSDSGLLSSTNWNPTTMSKHAYAVAYTAQTTEPIVSSFGPIHDDNTHRIAGISSGYDTGI